MRDSQRLELVSAGAPLGWGSGAARWRPRYLLVDADGGPGLPCPPPPPFPPPWSREAKALELQDLTQEKERLQMEVTFLQDRVSTLKGDNNALATKLQTLQRQAENRRADCDDILGHKQAEVVEKDGRIATLEGELKGLRQDLEEKNATIQKMAQEKQRTNSKLESALEVETDKIRLEDMLRRETGIIKRQEEELEKLRHVSEEMHAQMEELKQENEDLRLKSSAVTAMHILFHEPWLVSKSRFRLEGEVPPDRDDNTISCVGERLFLYGGASGAHLAHSEESAPDLAICSVDGKRWAAHGGFDSGGERTGHGAAPVGGSRLVVVGGRNGRLDGEAAALNLEAAAWEHLHTRGDCPMREFHSTVSYKDRVYVFGGLNEGGQYQNDMYALKLEQREWYHMQAYGSVPSPRRGASLCASEDGKKIYLMGGFDGSKPLNDIYIFETERKTWTSSTPSGALSPAPRERHAATIINNYLLVSGGTTLSSGGTARKLGDTWVLDLEMMEWECLDKGGGSQDMFWLKARGEYSVFSGNRLLSLKPNRDEKLSEIEVLEFTMPSEIEGLQVQRSSRDENSMGRLEILDEPIVTLGTIEVAWRPPAKNIERIEKYKLMMATNTGVVKEVCQGKYTRYKVGGLRSNTQYIFCVKAMYDDGSFIWSESKGFYTK